MRNHAVTLILLLVAVVLGIWLWRGRDRVTAGEKQRRENNVFPAWRRDELTKIEIAHEGETVVLERTPRAGQSAADATWRMTSPRQERADVAALERLETTLEFATVVRKVGRGDERALGLEVPRAHGAITMGGLVVRFALGAPSPRPDGSAYFVVDEGEPFVVSKELTESLLAGADTYRDRTVVPYRSLELQSFEIEKPDRPGPPLVLDRLDDRSFKVRGPGLLGSRSAIDRLWGTLAEIRAEAFPKDADADALTAHPHLRVRMTPKEAGKGVAELVFGEACPGHPEDVVVLRKVPSRVAACAPRGAADALAAVTADTLVDRRPFSFRADEIEELRLEWVAPPVSGAPRAIELARRGHGFHEREPVDRELPAEEADAASELLGRIEISAADEVTHGGGPFEPAARARVRSGDHEETIELAAPEAGKTTRTIRRVRDDGRLLVSAAVARRFEPRRTSLRPRVLLDEKRRVRRVLLQCGAEQELVDEGTGLRLVRPAGYETDGSITQLVDGLLKGKVLAWVADADDGTFGLGPDASSRCDVVLSFEDGNTPARVRFGAEGEGGVYGVVEGRPEVFSAPPSLRTLAGRIYVSRGALRVQPDAVESVKVRSRSAPTAALADATALREAAGALVAERVVALAPTEPAPAPIDLEITIALGADGGRGSTKRIACTVEEGATGARRCWTPEVRAVLEVSRPTIARFFAHAPIQPEAGVDAR